LSLSGFTSAVIIVADWQMQEVRTRLGENGRVVIPAEFRRRLGLKVGDPLVVRLDEDGLSIESRRAAVRAAQRMVRERVPKGELLTKGLFDMRRAETRGE
jgi:AbrB family looped-hinge helix DNA binding protein